MDRRNFLKSTGGIAAVAAGCASTAVQAGGAPDAAHVAAKERRTFTFACPWEAHPAGFAGDAHRLARSIESALNGAVTFDIRTASTSPSDFAVSFVGADTSLHPAFAYFGGLPGSEALPPRDLDDWLSTGGGQELWDELSGRFGFKALLAGHTGPNTVLWSKSPVSRPEDLAGRRVVVRGLDADVIRALGAIPVVADERRLEQALPAADTDAAAWGGLVQASAAGLPQHFPFAVTGALGAAGGAVALKISLSAWQSLSAHEQMIISTVANSEFRLSLADAGATRSAVENALVSRYATRFSRPSADFAAAVSRICAAVVAHTAAHDATSSRIDRSYTAYRRASAAESPELA